MLLSIVIPSYNHEKYVLRTLQAAARIDIQDKEIIVIDDGSSDNSQHIIRQYIASMKPHINIRLIARENRGLVKTLNEGLNIALGKYFYAVASDDIPIPESISTLVQVLESNTGSQFAMGNALVMYSEDQQTFRSTYGASHARFFSLPLSTRRKEMFMNYPHPLLLQATVFRVSALKEIGGWREDLILDDFSLFVRILSLFPNVENDFSYHPQIAACFYRQHPTNSYKNISRQFMMVEQALNALCPKEWLPTAISRKAAYYIQVALRRGRIREAAALLFSTVNRVGTTCFMRASAYELAGMLARRLTANTPSLQSPGAPYTPAVNVGMSNE